ncbi:uracil-DNA glycosylase [Halogranum rubrum]|uniref:Uracil-DNA glycosylase n=1 Tax=Halogranum salarium B-1 TaxID=1210908 RepID=J2ZG93_9EURY|nr:uracil-DNA glycosylase family protein [Halogranum salarium]EJN59685.1 uracil-DNA glycosylase [Halogranum salarium B-1]
MPQHPPATAKHVLEPDCTRCPALVDSRTCISWGTLPVDEDGQPLAPDAADIVVVGEAPGAGDPDAETWKGGNHTGLAYTARHSGRRIRSLFEHLGYGARTYYTNAVKCFPGDGDGSNREPTRAELDNCRGHLETELAWVDPAVVVATGKHATETILAFEGTEVDGFLDSVLDPVDCPSLGVTLLPILHPSYQEVWLSRLGYTADEYRDEIAARLP